MSAEQSVLRTSLLPGLLGAVAYNWSHRNHGVRLFEVGHTFNRPTDVDAERCAHELALFERRTASVAIRSTVPSSATTTP